MAMGVPAVAGAEVKAGAASTRADVRALQRKVGVAADGIFGPATERAVKRWQRRHGLAADGIVGPQTWPKLVVQIKKGSTGDAVRALQEVMKFHDQSNGEGPGVQIDGVFGPRTDAFVRGFQTAIGTPSDGIVGPITWRGLVSGMFSG
jgi:peptidoglycan hydrolase-like protein with peptidoglycan-binding domain